MINLEEVPSGKNTEAVAKIRLRQVLQDVEYCQDIFGPSLA